MFVQLVALISPILLDKSQAATRRSQGRGYCKGPSLSLSCYNLLQGSQAEKGGKVPGHSVACCPGAQLLVPRDVQNRHRPCFKTFQRACHMGKLAAGSHLWMSLGWPLSLTTEDPVASPIPCQPHLMSTQDVF